MAEGREFQTATLLPDGKVLVTGGYNSVSGFLASTELYDPASERWSSTARMNTPRWWHTATLLPNGTVLVAGSEDVGQAGAKPNASNVPASAELYDPATGTWTTTGSMITGRWVHTATLLTNGKVLVAGGYPGPLASAELYDPGAESGQ